MKFLILGSTGMLGSVLFRTLSNVDKFQVFGTTRHQKSLNTPFTSKFLFNLDVRDIASLKKILIKLEPDVIVNCIGLIKQKEKANQYINAIELNSLLPHQLYEISKEIGARLIHISTDCVFSGNKGMYTEADFTDATDFYGKSKALGEIQYDDAITLRTSIIGHELNSSYSLLEWFLSQKDQCKGYKNAIFSGLPTVVFAELIRDYIIPNNKISGLYHIAATPIDKYELLKIIAKVYNKDIKIEPDENVRINRSLDASKFHKMTGYISPDWQSLIESMYEFNNKN